LYVSTRT